MSRTILVGLVVALLLATVPAHAAPRETAPSLLAPLGERLMAAPFEAPAEAQALADAYALAPTSLAHLYETSLSRVHNEAVAAPTFVAGPLVVELARARALASEPMTLPEILALAQQTSRLDPALERALAELVAGANAATLARGEPFAALSLDELAYLAHHAMPGAPVDADADLAQLLGEGEPTDLLAARAVLARVDTAALHRAHLAMATGVDRAVALLPTVAAIAPGTIFSTDSPYGRILVRGTGNDVYAAGDEYFVTIDLGGNDTYNNRAGGSVADVLGLAATPSPPFPTDPTFPAWVVTAYGFAHRANNASIAIDLAGNDLYAASYEGVQGFGAFGGFGALVDLQGSDTYEGTTFAQGAGITGGAGFLVDVAGDDRYHAIQEAQGFAIDAGAGFLADIAGADVYSAEVLAQGTGYSANVVGLLIDGEGSDVYDCYGERDFSGGILPVAASRPGTICHAAGFGGTGVQVDLAGDDSYTTFSSFQTLTLIGTGVQVDGAGNDRRIAGEWSNAIAVLGAAVIVDGAGNDVYQSDHRQFLPWADIYLGSNGEGYQGVGVLADGAGDDAYSATARKDLWLVQYACSQGCGFGIAGVGILLEGGGSDRYSTEVGEGAGVTAIGVLVEAGGDDVYALTQGSTRGQGYAGESSEFLDEGITECWYGALVDLDGADSYSNPVVDFGARANDRYWGQGEFGRGMDDTAGAQGYAQGRLFTDVGKEVNTRACNQLGL